MTRILTIIIFLTGGISAVFAGPKKLKFPERKNSIETLSPFVRGLAVNKDKILIFPTQQRKMVIWTPYHGPNETREKTFGKLIDSKRTDLNLKIQSTFRPSTAVPYENHFILLNPDESGLVQMFDKKHFGVYRTFALDLLKPPRDRGGEGTSYEIADFRKKFMRNFYDTDKEPYSGITPVPKAWMKTTNDLYFIATRIKGFPLLIMECRKDEPTQCKLIRGCILKGKKLNPAKGFSGIAAHPTKEILLFSHADSKTIIQYRYNSCSSGSYMREFTIPDRMKGLSAMTIDNNGDLWLGAPFKDDYLNASVYRWPEKEWMSN